MVLWILWMFLHQSGILHQKDDPTWLGSAVIIFGMWFILGVFIPLFIAIIGGKIVRSYLYGFISYLLCFSIVAGFLFIPIWIDSYKKTKSLEFRSTKHTNDQRVGIYWPISIIKPENIYVSPSDVRSPIEIEVYVSEWTYTGNTLPIALYSDDGLISVVSDLIFSGKYAENGRKIFRWTISFAFNHPDQRASTSAILIISVNDPTEKIYNGSPKKIWDRLNVILTR